VAKFCDERKVFLNGKKERKMYAESLWKRRRELRLLRDDKQEN
jgi:hypothetical protein